MKRSNALFVLVNRAYTNLGLNDFDLLKKLRYHFNHPNYTPKLATMHYKHMMSQKLGHYDFIPKTFIIKNSKDLNKLNLKPEDEGKIWFFKPAYQDKGVGIIVDNYHNIKKKYNRLRGIYVLQDRIKPFLINNKKFNIRCYILIFGEKKKMFLYKDGYILMASKDYDPNNTSKFAQITNFSVNVTDENYDIKKQVMFFKKETFEHYDDIFPQIVNISKKIYQNYKNKLININNNFIIGFDIMVDENKKCWLIEMNFNASLCLNDKYLYDNVIKQLGEDIISLYLNKDNKWIILD